MHFKKPLAVGEVTVAATPADAYRVISDPLLMITFAEEAYRARWLRGARTAAVGARFRGYNRNGLRRWFTNCTVTDAESDRRFAYYVHAPCKVPISRWQYDITPTGDGGCTITETNWLRVPLWFIPFAMLITGVFNRPGANDRHIATTLERLKHHLEGSEPAQLRNQDHRP